MLSPHKDYMSLQICINVGSYRMYSKRDVRDFTGFHQFDKSVVTNSLGYLKI